MNALGTSRDSSGYHMTLGRLLEGFDVAAPHGLQVTDLVQDSRAATPGSVFLACQGRSTHGLSHAASAVERGAIAVLWEPGAGIELPALPERVAAIAMPHLGRHVGELADRFFRSPRRTCGSPASPAPMARPPPPTCSRRHRISWAAAAGTSARSGTAIPATCARPGLTTPDAVTVQRRLAEARDAGAATLGLEVSSHALDQDRVAGVSFDTAVFTNLTRDHLDYHGSSRPTARPRRACSRTPTCAAPSSTCAIRSAANWSSGSGGRSRRSCSRRRTTSGPSAAPAGSACPSCARPRSGLTLSLATSWGDGMLRSRLVGEFNAENLLAVLGVLLGWDVPLQKALAALALCVAPPGRMEAFGGGAQPLVLVDYAHSPDALGKALDAARAHARGRLFCVFGCGGDRDPGKRPLMGAVAEAAADVADRHRRQPAHRGLRRDHRADPRRHARARCGAGRSRSRRGDPARAGRGARLATWWWSPARATRTTRSWAPRRARSATATRCRQRCAEVARMMSRDLATLAAAAGGELHGANVAFDARDQRLARARAGRICSSRSRGERFDGHDFVAEAAPAGRGRRARQRARSMRRCRRSMVPDALAGARASSRAPGAATTRRGRRRHRQQWQDHGQGDDRRDPGAARPLPRHAGQPQQPHRRAADAVPAATPRIAAP